MTQLANLNSYEWKEIGEGSPSNQINKLMDDVKKNLKVENNSWLGFNVF